ncbi:hypothetical protein FOA43_002868 [Brettanomyces nanus]|uniref:Uncharacterized protein n=1 Tax=Eeniella nana TaxID=13502 RepID=A0A875S3P2_EENNA|nr:uncharacterized protein FOA43_002868 [Brettanomyces nanus]QPG75513.1 hypothetical protein FOA43_002868 [Brettanomyces nanus]
MSIREKMKKSWKFLDADQKRFTYWLAYGSYGPREGFPNVYDYYTSIKGTGSPSGTSVFPPSGTSVFPPSGTPASPVSRILQDDSLGQLIQEINPKKDSQREAFILQNSTSKIVEETKKIDALEMSNRKQDVPPDLPFRYPSVLRAINPSSYTIASRLPALDPRSFGIKRLQQYQFDRNTNPYNRFIVATLVVLTVLAFKKDRKVNLSGIVPEYGWKQEQEEIQQTQKRQQNEILSLKLKNAMEQQQQQQQQQQHLQEPRRWYYLWLF